MRVHLSPQRTRVVYIIARYPLAVIFYYRRHYRYSNCILTALGNAQWVRSRVVRENTNLHTFCFAKPMYAFPHTSAIEQ